MSAYCGLIRPRIIAMVLFAMAVAAWTASDRAPPWRSHALVGTGLLIAGAVAFNQRLECRGDGRMPRTAGRPLPSGRLIRTQVTRFGVITTAAGFSYLLLLASPCVVALAALSWVLYVWTYTPLKSITPWQTPVGALAGAMPVLLGAAVAEAPPGPMALSLFGIVYFWQFPHSMAIAWLYRHEFASAGVKLATVVDPTGRVAGILAVLGAVALLPVSLIPSALSLVDRAYGVVVVLLGAGYLACAIRFLRCRNDVTGRWLLRVSLVYLPGLLVVLLL
jgi:protoheme IX farnesyltransferase